MKVVALETATEDLDDACLAHFFLYGWVFTNIEEYIEGDEKEFVLLPDEDVEFFELGFGGDFILLFIPSPHFNILTIE